VRDHNEDAVLAHLPVLAVADGVGGASKGEVASTQALEAAHNTLLESTEGTAADNAVRAAEAANRAVYEAQSNNAELAGMATTLTLAVVDEAGNVALAHVGDSRAYRITADSIEQITEDHSIVGELVRSGRLDAAEAEAHPQRNVITRALGADAHVAIDSVAAKVQTGEWLLICSDGLTGHVDDASIASIVRSADNLDVAAETLIAEANAGGGKDNISVVIARRIDPDQLRDVEISTELDVIPIDAVEDTGSIPVVEATPEAGPTKIAAVPPTPPATSMRLRGEPPARKRGNRKALGLVVGVIVMAFAFGLVAWQHSYYLVERSDGLIGANQGFPIPGMHREWRTSDVSADDLDASDKSELLETTKLHSKEDITNLLDSLPERAGQCDGASLEAVQNPDC
jgi:protein phosphatase